MCRVLNKHHAAVPAGAVYVGRGTRWGNPFALRSATTGLVRVPGVLTGRDWEFEGRVSGDGTRHDYHHGDGRNRARGKPGIATHQTRHRDRPQP